MPRFLVPLVAVLVAVTFVPLAYVAKARAGKSRTTGLHLVLDMDQSPAFGPQEGNPAFADGRSMRPPVPGTVARDELMEDDAIHRGRTGGEWVADIPVPVTKALLLRGQERYAVFCAACHGHSGDGRGPVAVRAEELEEGTFTPPSSYHQEPALSRPAGHLFNSITNGIRNMAAYGPQIPVMDRWAIVAYVRALIRSQRATIEDVPEEYRNSLK